ncbi:hypothetical protein AB0M26_29835, partial [Streptomyces sp. NPDC051776]
MRAHKIATATMLVLAVSGWGVAAGSGTAFADTSPAHGRKAKRADEGHRPAHGGKAKARAEGGSTTGEGADLFQQNIAQEGRQNNNCSNSNDGDVTLTGGARARGRCVTADGSLNAFSRIRNGPAIAQSGSGGTNLFDQNTAQRGRQNNNCNNPNNSVIDLDGDQLQGLCADQDLSFNKYTFVKNGGARAQSGDSGTENDTEVQNAAQVGRQNNNCNNLSDSDINSATEEEVGGGGRVAARCANKDHSFNHTTLTTGRGARAQGGFGTDLDVNQQNTAQEGRQNNNCNNPNNDSDIFLDGSRVKGLCGNKDHSLNHKTLTKGGGARARGGNGTVSDIDQQSTAQEGRQNNNCNNPNDDSEINPDLEAGGSRVEGLCGNKDHSLNHKTLTKGRGARADGGSATLEADQQNTAQEGRQNNNCNNATEDSDINSDVETGGGRVKGLCGNKDHSLNHKTFTKSGGARADGGSAAGEEVGVSTQSTAQEGRQNNNCNNRNDDSDLDVEGGGRVTGRCGNKDHSLNHKTLTKGRGARAEGGSATLGVDQTNTAQEG